MTAPPTLSKLTRFNAIPARQCSMMLRDYFRSGWAFLIPYLLAYLLYAWLKWPVNPVAEIAERISGSASVVRGQSGMVPPLLHVYWGLHAVHTVLGAIALRVWWVGHRSEQEIRNSEQVGYPIRPATRCSLLATFSNALPWICLALIFYIPGIYLEWPSDPWEHLRRINEWKIHSNVFQHSSWYKSTYFLPYSLTFNYTGINQLNWLSIYYTGTNLLLSWQYYRLGRSVGLSDKASFLFVALNALTFGNNILSFYRYYGLSSSIIAQMGAVVLTRIAVDSTRTLTSNTWRRPDSQTKGIAPISSRTHPPIYHLSIITLMVVALIAFNHIQGVGIAAISVGAVFIWVLIQWKRAMIVRLLLVATLTSIATIIWFPRNPLLDEVYRPEGWLTATYAFNFFSITSPTFERSLQIFGLLGIFNLLLGLWFAATRNHIIGWLTITPVIALSLPCVALPLASSLADRSSTEIVTFHRMLFASPCGLSLSYMLSCLVARTRKNSRNRITRLYPGFAISILGIVIAVLSPVHPIYNRLYNLLAVPPQDLQLYNAIQSLKKETSPDSTANNTSTTSPDSTAQALNSFAPNIFPFRERKINDPVTQNIAHKLHYIYSSRPTRYGEKVNLNNDPLINDPNAWERIVGDIPETTSDKQNIPNDAHALQNPSGEQSGFITSELIPISPAKTYRMEATLKQVSASQANAYLTIAWYNNKGTLLDSDIPKPIGAGLPNGWENGTYSYYGIIGTVAPVTWTTYRTTFGSEQFSEIPSNASYVRVGALLNFNYTPTARVLISNIYLWEKTEDETNDDGIFTEFNEEQFVFPNYQSLYSSTSYSGQLSGHWKKQAVATSLAGRPEIEAAFLSSLPSNDKVNE